MIWLRNLALGGCIGMLPILGSVIPQGIVLNFAKQAIRFLKKNKLVVSRSLQRNVPLA